MPIELRPDFFDDLYTEEYVNEILNIQYSIERKSGKGELKDCHSRYYNVKNGERCTTGQPDSFTKSVYFFGPCFVYGHYAEDSFTVESLLQKQINESKYGGGGVRVVNCGSPSYSPYISREMARIIDTPFRKGDIVVLYSNNRKLAGADKNIDLVDSLKRNNINSSWIVDIPQHCNHKINSLYAEAIYNMLQPILKENINKVGEVIGKDKDFIKMLFIDRYFNKFNVSLYNKIGAIVMNCNPFTYGHRYLIEQALRVVDFLIIFVVEEDKSIFSFAERLALVCDGVADLDNIKVVPSGPFILSQMTFPEYFIKEADEDIVENVENDITIFAEKIAPHLNIRYRFVGEEPGDAVTNEYNLAMKRILPEWGIKLIEIPRKQLKDKYISASLVRKCLEDNDVELIEQLVPESTWKMILP